MKVRDLVTELRFKTDDKKIESFDAKIKSVTIAVTALAASLAAATTAAFMFVKSAAATGDELDKIKNVVGLTTEEIQLLSGAAALAGVEHNNLIVSLQFFAKSVGMARQGMAQQLNAFKMLDVSLRGANGLVKTQHELLLDVADGFKNLKTQQDKAVVSQMLFSRGGGKMLNLFAEGREGINKLTAEVSKYAFIMNEKAVKDSADFTDAMFLMNLAIKGLKDQIGLALMPIFKKFVKQTLEWIVVNRKMLALRIKEFFKAIIFVTEKLVKVFQFIANTVSFLTSVFKVFNNEFHYTIVLLEALLALQLVRKIKLIGSAFRAMKAGMAILFSPIGLITAGFLALLLVLDDINAYSEGKDSLLGRFVKEYPKLAAAFAPMKQFITQFLIDPLLMVLKLINRIKADLKIPKFKPISLAGGFQAIGPERQLGHIPGIGEYLNILRHRASASGATIAAGAGNVSINTTVNLAVPEGTTSSQQSFLISSAHDAFESSFSKVMKSTLVSFPGVEK